MQSRIDGENYLVLQDGHHITDRINKDETDNTIKNLCSHLHGLSECLLNLYDRNYDLYSLLSHEAFDMAGLDLDGGKCWRLDFLYGKLQQIQNSLLNNHDDIRIPEECIMLEDLDFQESFWGHHIDAWEKVLEDNDEREILEEIFCNPDPVHRIRTTIWKKDGYSLSSESITYKTLPLSKELKIALKNSIQQKHNH